MSNTVIFLYLIFMTPTASHLEVVKTPHEFYLVSNCVKAGEMARHTIETADNISVSYTCTGIEYEN